MLRHFKKYQSFEEKAYLLLETVLLKSKSSELAKNLAHGEKRKLEIAMLLALETEVLLLDEPTAGMSLEEVPTILNVIRRIKEEGNRLCDAHAGVLGAIPDCSGKVALAHDGERRIHFFDTGRT